MDPKVKEFFILSTAVLALAVFYLLRRKTSSQKIYLGLKKEAETSSNKGVQSLAASSIKVNTKLKSRALSKKEPSSFSKKNSLKVMFNYNGHSWDAYEVLGVSVDSSLESIKEAFDKSVAQVDSESRFFVETAYEAIQSHLKDRVDLGVESKG